MLSNNAWKWKINRRTHFEELLKIAAIKPLVKIPHKTTYAARLQRY